MTITTRAGKGSALSHNEMDTNFTDLRDGVGGIQVPKTSGLGIKVDSGGSTNEPAFFTLDIHYQSTSIGTKQKAPDFWT